MLNSKIAVKLGYSVRHCEGIGKCLRMLRELGLQAREERLVTLIDYELETGARRAVDTILDRLRCECRGWAYSINCCRCMEGRLVMVLFEGGPEETLQRLGYPLDHAILNRLKSHRLWRGEGGRAEEAVERLAQLVEDYCGQWL